VGAAPAVVGVMMKPRVVWSIASGLGQAVAVAGVALATAIGRGEQVRDALPFTAALATVVFGVGSGAAYLVAKLRGMS